MSPIEHRRLPPHARQVASCSGFSKVHLEQIVSKERIVPISCSTYDMTTCSRPQAPPPAAF